MGRVPAAYRPSGRVPREGPVPWQGFHPDVVSLADLSVGLPVCLRGDLPIASQANG
ncbi:hypothetical protein TRIP_B50620 [uncultured Desulfatiglans sp.]|nr:hypothetical protein TRIP_B50620 [uncultured Desulfatiglans sp.]